jgi:adenylate kinase family enzyme
VIKKIAVAGNAGAGKTTLSLRLAEIYHLPLVHVDLIQFDEKMNLRPAAAALQHLREIQEGEAWIMDGYGPLDLIEKRFELADRVVFIDWPLWRHYWWSTKRLIKQFAAGKFSWPYTLKLYRTILKVHRGMRPQLLKIFARENLKSKVVYIRNLKDWRQIYSQGI